jgi:hypothetical protein
MKLRNLAAASALALAASAGASNAASVLIFGDRASAQNEVQRVLEAAGDVVTNVSRSIAETVDFSAFDTIWSLSFNSAYSAALETMLTSFVDGGGGLYLTFERPCCEAANGSVERIINASLSVGSVTVGGFGDVSGTFTYNANAIGNLDGDLASGWLPSQPGQIDGVTGNSVVVSSNATGRAVPAGPWRGPAWPVGRPRVPGDLTRRPASRIGRARQANGPSRGRLGSFVAPIPRSDPGVGPRGLGLGLGLGGAVSRGGRDAARTARRARRSSASRRRAAERARGRARRSRRTGTPAC